MRKKLTKEQFILQARQVHGWKYDYSKVEYVNNKTKVCIICPEHGEFWQTPNNHLKTHGCVECGKIKQHDTTCKTLEQFINDAKKIHGDKYDYSKVNYINSLTHIAIICKKHGIFKQTPNAHLSGCGCPKCKGFNKTTEEFIEQSKIIHGEKFDYSKTKYINYKTKICVVCHKKDKYGSEHGEFWLLPNNHLKGFGGCPKCREYKLEADMRNLLHENKIDFIEQKTFDWLKYRQGVKTIDFYLPKHRVAIECQGEQHFKPVDFAGKGKKWAIEKLDLTLEHDKYKKIQCEKHGIKMLYYSNLGIEYPYEVIEDKNKIIQIIKMIKL